MNLARLQRDLAAMIRGEAVASPDAYIASVAASPGLEATREIIASWRELLLRRACPLTVALLEQRGRLSSAFADLGGRHLSAYIEAAACAFLDRFLDDGDALLASVAQFERAVIGARQGSDDAVTITWPYPPDAVIERLLQRRSVGDDLTPGTYTLTVSAEAAP